MFVGPISARRVKRRTDAGLIGVIGPISAGHIKRGTDADMLNVTCFWCVPDYFLYHVIFIVVLLLLEKWLGAGRAPNPFSRQC